MRSALTGLCLAVGISSLPAVDFTIGSDYGNTTFHRPGVTDVGQVFIFPGSGFSSTFELTGITFWANASPSTVQFKLGYVNSAANPLFYEGYSTTYTFGAGGGDGQFETVHFDLPNLQFPSGFYVLGYFTGLPDNASFRLNSWSSDAYTSELNYLNLYNAGDATCSIYFRENGVWGHAPNDAGFLAEVTGTWTGDMSDHKQIPTTGFLPGVPLAPGFQLYGGTTPDPGNHNVCDPGSSLSLLGLSLFGLGFWRRHYSVR